MEEGGRRAVSLGIGVNLARAPALPDRATAALTSEILAPAPAAFLDLLDAALTERLATYARDGLVPIRAAWLAVAAGLGEPITVNLPNAAREGTFGGIDETGALILLTDEGSVTVTAGDVFFRRERA